MDTKKAEKIIRIYNWTRAIISILILMFVIVGLANAQSYRPEIHGILRGKYEYQPEMESGRFE